MTCPVPIIDFSACEYLEENLETNDNIKNLATDIYSAFSTIGFVYLKNHGIPQEMVDNAFEKSLNFFTLPKDTKEQYLRPTGLNNHGWCQMEREQLNPERPGDYKEMFDVSSLYAKDVWAENNEVNGFQKGLEDLYYSCRLLALKLLKLIGIGLRLEDPEYLSKKHSLEKPTYTALRSLYYPAFNTETELKENQLRCGEHTDYGSLTILFQDEVGGLEVFTRQGNFVPAVPIPGTVIVNLGDLMQRWTADRLVSTKHRVVNVTKGKTSVDSRQSIVCFVHPDEDCMIECVDGSQKYPPIKDKDYIEKRFKETNI